MAEQNASYLRAEAAHQSAAKDHRGWAQQLLKVEREACSELGPIERNTSPFVRGPDILSVKAHMEGETLRGARVTFRRVKGLSKTWILKSIGCHSARAATLGFAKEFMPHCPLALQDTSAEVVEDAATVIVTLSSKDPIVAAQIYGRALRAADDEEAKAEGVTR